MENKNEFDNAELEKIPQPTEEKIQGTAEEKAENSPTCVDNSTVTEENTEKNHPIESIDAICAIEEEKYKLRHYIGISTMITLLAVLITFLITYITLTSSYNAREDDMWDEYNEMLDSLGEFKSIAELYNALPEEMRNIDTYKKLAYLDYYYRTSYVGEIDEEQLVYMIAQGYIAGIGDQFGAYYSSDEFSAMLKDTEGNSVGIGVYVTYDVDTGLIRISYVMKDSPANKAGLLPGDVVTHVDGVSVTALGYYGGLDAVKGEEGTDVVLTVNRGGEIMTKTLTRAKVVVESVIYTTHENDPHVGVIRIIEFNNQTPQQFKDAVSALMEQGCTSLVYDLRSNPGGTLSSVVEILDFLLPEGDIVTVRYVGGEKYVYRSDDAGEEFSKLYGTNVKMAVLVNGYTASAAELFTCALKDYGIAVVVGEKTFGKGCGQSVVPLDGGSGLAITTFLYDPPKSENYNGKGILPDVVEELSEEASQKNLFELSHQEDNQLNAALNALK